MSTRAYHLYQNTPSGKLKETKGRCKTCLVLSMKVRLLMEAGRLFVMKLLWKLDEAGDKSTRIASFHVIMTLARNPGTKPKMVRWPIRLSSSIIGLPASNKPLLEPRTRTVNADFFSRVDALVGTWRELSTATQSFLLLCIASPNPPSKHRVPRQQTACPTGKALW